LAMPVNESWVAWVGEVCLELVALDEWNRKGPATELSSERPSRPGKDSLRTGSSKSQVGERVGLGVQ